MRRGFDIQTDGTGRNPRTLRNKALHLSRAILEPRNPIARAATTTDVFNAIAEMKRREMIGLLNDGKYWTVSEIVGRMKITQPTASKHLLVLHKVGIVTVLKHGRYRRYRLNAQSLRPLFDWARMSKGKWNCPLDSNCKRPS
ncbi:ArsR/SmtB family transcription factor [Edaphobacter bradus]|uniref:ArsR/SmtB family transcription factor n=1 Tax=Edaphobacter bradus TaxID=2259016 RepID=UPI0037BF94B5